MGRVGALERIRPGDGKSPLDGACLTPVLCAARNGGSLSPYSKKETTGARREALGLTMPIHLLVLNHNGRRLLEQCLPSVIDAAAASSYPCDVAVVDNDSRDDSVAWLARRFPQVRVIRQPNRGLCSFNDVVPGLEGPVAILLNNDIKLDRHCIDPLVAPLVSPHWESESSCFMTAPLCWLFDGETYEGFKTAVCWRWGLVRATARFPGHESTIRQPGLTASAGAVLAVDRRKFAALGGFDPLFLPGRLEDLDFAFRGYLAGYHARYVPAAVAYHRGMATFGPVFGPSGCDQLALRNTLLFQWKNLRHPAHRARQLTGLPLRLIFDLVRAPWVSRWRRWAFTRAFVGAFARWRRLRSTCRRAEGPVRREREFFQRFHPSRLVSGGSAVQRPLQPKTARPPSVGLEAIPKPLTPGPSPRKRGEGRRFSDGCLAAVGTAAQVPSDHAEPAVEAHR